VGELIPADQIVLVAAVVVVQVAPVLLVEMDLYLVPMHLQAVLE
jgi:hypothetical protein